MQGTGTFRCLLSSGRPGGVPDGAMAPIFERAATELEPEVRLIKVDSDAVPELLPALLHPKHTDADVCAPRPGDCAHVGAHAPASVAGVDPRTCRRHESLTSSADSIISRAIWLSIPF